MLDLPGSQVLSTSTRRTASSALMMEPACITRSRNRCVSPNLSLRMAWAEGADCGAIPKRRHLPLHNQAIVVRAALAPLWRLTSASSFMRAGHVAVRSLGLSPDSDAISDHTISNFTASIV